VLNVFEIDVSRTRLFMFARAPGSTVHLENRLVEAARFGQLLLEITVDGRKTVLKGRFGPLHNSCSDSFNVPLCRKIKRCMAIRESRVLAIL
jgi:hypothetical protein